MTRQLMIAVLCLETSLLAGSAVVIGQLWTRSNQAEDRAGNYRTDLQTTLNQLEKLQSRADEADADVVEFAQKLTTAESDLREQQVQLADFQAAVTRLETQNEELVKTADQAVELSDQVVALQMKLDARGDEVTPDDEQLVQVQRPEGDVEEDELVPFDDTGWRSIYPPE